VYPIGCAGLITHADTLADGRHNIVLRGLAKFRVTAEDDGRPYRVARAETIMEPLDDADREVMRGERRRLEALLVPQPEGRGVDPTSDFSVQRFFSGSGRYSTRTLLTIATVRPGVALSRPAAVVASRSSPSRLTW